MRTRRANIPNNREQIDEIEAWLLGELATQGYPEAARFAVRLALEEALANAFRHGHRNLPDATVTVEIAIDQDRVEMVVEDQGPGFAPEAVPDPTLEQNLELPTGRGLLLIRSFMTCVEYEGRGNRVRMVYERPAAPEPDA